MNYLPFDLKTALKHPERVVTRDGRKVEGIHYFDGLNPKRHPIYGIIDDEINNWNDGGAFLKDCETNFDLFLLPEVKKVWVNVYEGDYGEIVVGGKEHTTKEAAISSASVDNELTYIKTICITNEPE